ncbi:hypothetical protein NC652_029030 [Populus alba x Populus x berolinensis]|uniref:Uncharacterized protein n=1 Tax=Populus alba x Populus x berolinensis TaxID=444605 RepID=A0AAD6M1M4_9ROSI|nr:hypothetical protein NC652_029030 [Populus alba x Populus x berolinensis]KAJ6976709.1 hypothetical protein NC653_028771 [Populus alba x Populus x berolinensis]
MAALGMCGTVFGVDGEREGRRGGVGDGFHGVSLSSAFVQRLLLLQPHGSAPVCGGCPRRFISTVVGVVGHHRRINILMAGREILPLNKSVTRYQFALETQNSSARWQSLR